MLKEASNDARNTALDPGLRRVYPNLPRAPIRVIACPLEKSVNHGGIMRVSEAYRIERVEFEPTRDETTDAAGAVGVFDWQPARWIGAKEAVFEAKAEGYRIYGLTLNDRAVDLHAASWVFPCAIVLGEEKLGIPPEVEEQCDEYVAIPMYGMVGSINVGMACALALDVAVGAYAKADPTFEPARNVSRRLLGMPDVSYLEESGSTESSE